MDPPRRFRRWRENRGEKRTRTRARRGPREQRGPLKRDNARVDAHELRQAPYIRNRAWMARRSRVSLISRDNGEMLIYRGVPSKQAAPACTHSSGENMPCGRERRLCRRWRPLLILHAAKTQRSGHNRISIWSIARRTAGIFARARLGCCSSFRAWPCFIISDSEMCLAPHRVTLVIFESPSLASPTLVEIRAGSRVSELDDIVESPNNTVA